MKHLIVGIGIPGSGKTTALKMFAAKNGYLYVCPDEIREKMTGHVGDKSKNPEAWEEANKEMFKGLKEAPAVVFDSTLANPAQRKQFLDSVRETIGDEEIKIDGVFVDTPFEIAQERNLKRGELGEKVVPLQFMERARSGIHDFPPGIEDGLDTLFTLNENQQLVKAELAWEGKENLTKEFRPR